MKTESTHSADLHQTQGPLWFIHRRLIGLNDRLLLATVFCLCLCFELPEARAQTNGSAQTAAATAANQDASLQVVQPLLDLLAKSERGRGTATAQTIANILSGQAQAALQQSASNWFFANARSPEIARRRQAMFCLGQVMPYVDESFQTAAYPLALELATDPDLEARASALTVVGQAIQRMQGSPDEFVPKAAGVLLTALKETDPGVQTAAVTGLAYAVNRGLKGPLLDQAAPELLKRFTDADENTRFYLRNSLPALVANVKDPQISQQVIADVKARAAAAQSDHQRAEWLQTLGELQFALGRYGEAVDTFRQALNVTDHQNPWLNQRLEAALWAAGRGDEVLDSPAIRMSSGDVQLRMQAFARTNDVVRLVKLANRALDGYLATYRNRNFPRNSRGEPDMVIAEATRLLLAMKKFDELQQFLDGALERYTNSPDAWVGRIRLLRAQNQNERALEVCEQDLGQHPWNAEVPGETRQICEELKQPERYETILRTVVKQHPGEPVICRPLVEHYVSSGRTNEAKQVIAAYRTTQTDPDVGGVSNEDSWEARERQAALSTMLEMVGDFDGALVAYEKETRSQREMQSYEKQRLASLYRRAGKTNELARMEAEDPVVRLQSLQEKVHAQIRAGKLEDAVATARQIFALDLKKNDRQNAWSVTIGAFGNEQQRLVPVLDEILAKDTNNLAALHYLTLLASSRSDFRQAMDYAERGYRLVPNDYSAFTLLTGTCYRAGRFSRLFESVAEALRRESSEFDRNSTLGWPYPAFLDTNRFPNFAALVQQRLTNSTGSERLPLLRSRAHLEKLMGHQQAAVEIMRQVIAEPNQWSSIDQTFLIEEYLAMGKPDEALEACRQAAASQPRSYDGSRNDSWLQPYFIRLFRLKGRTNEIAAACQAECAPWLDRIKSGKEEPGTYNHVAWQYILNGVLPSEALELARKAAALAPDDALIRDTHAWALMRNGDFAGALDHFVFALTNPPVNVTARDSAWKALDEMSQSRVPDLLWTSTMDSLQEILHGDPVDLARLNLIRSRFYAQWGEVAKAAAYRLASGYPSESAWLILGPFANEQGEAHEHTFISETQEFVDTAAAYPTSLGPLRWIKSSDDSEDGVITLREIFPRLDWAAAYLYLSIKSDVEQSVELRLGSDDQAKVWLNGQSIFENTQIRPVIRDQDVVTVALRQGSNHLLVKICNVRENWAFTLRITAAGGKPITGVHL